MNNKTFTYLNNAKICEIIESAHKHIIYAAPSLSEDIAKAIKHFVDQTDNTTLRIIVDDDAEAFRLGFGDFSGIKILEENNIEVRKANGLRIAVLVADEQAWVYSPTPEIIFEQPNNLINNGVSVSKDFVEQIINSIAPEVNINKDVLDTTIISDSKTPEIGIEKFEKKDVEKIEKELEINPPQKFDAQRKVRVYEGYFQFVDIELKGCQINSHKISVPKYLLNLAKESTIKEKITTTYQLVNKESNVSKEFESIINQVNELRENFTDTVGRFGRIILRTAKEQFAERVDEIKDEIEKLQKSVQDELDEEIQISHSELAEALLPGVRENPPPKLNKQAFFGELDDKTIKDFIISELNNKTTNAEKLIGGMQLNCDYKNITYEMLNDEEFIELVTEKYPGIEKLYDEEEAIKTKKESNNS